MPASSRRLLCALPAAAVAVAALWWVFAKKTSGPIVIRFTGEILGELEPCNCSGKEAGGLPALAGYLGRKPDEQILLDIGCIGSGARDFEILRTHAVLRGMALMRYDAVNLGEHELWLGRDGIAKLGTFGVPFVSANVTDEDGQPVAEPWLCSGRAVAVTGLVDDDGYLPGPGLKVAEPIEALAALLPEMRERAELIILLADLGPEKIERILSEFPEIALLLFRGRGDYKPPTKINRTVIASIYGEARFVGEITFAEDGRGAWTFQGKAVELDENCTPDAGVEAAAVGWYKSAVRGKTFDISQPRPGWLAPTPAEVGDDRYVGSKACMECHEPSAEVWRAGKHSGAMAPLEKAEYDYSPECIVCHVVGYGASDGYVSREATAHLANVGCESCHGRGGRHVETQGKKLGGIVRGGEASCRPCHTPKRSTDFVYETAWPKIKHEER